MSTPIHTKTHTNPHPPRKRCVFCDRPATCGWQDLEGRLTPVCEGHRWIAVAASGNADSEFVKLAPTRKPPAGPISV